MLNGQSGEDKLTNSERAGPERKMRNASRMGHRLGAKEKVFPGWHFEDVRSCQGEAWEGLKCVYLV